MVYVLGQVLVQTGKVNFTVAYPDFLYCTTVQYPRTFSTSRNVRVLASISHGNEYARVQDSAVVWTSDVTQSSFRVCVLESGLGTNGSAIVNWIAFRGTPSGMLDGAASFSTFTSGTKCERVNFAQVNMASISFISIEREGIHVSGGASKNSCLFTNHGSPTSTVAACSINYLSIFNKHKREIKREIVLN